MRLWFKTDLAAPLADIAAVNLRYDDARIEDDGNDVLYGGYGALLAPLSADLPIRTDSVVNNILSNENGVSVNCTDGHVEIGSHVVVTTPLGVLKSNSVEFTPDLSVNKRAAIERLAFGNFEKLILRFETRFWDSSGDVRGFLIKGEPLFDYWIDLTAMIGKPTLVAHVTGESAQRLAAMDDAMALAEACAVL